MSYSRRRFLLLGSAFALSAGRSLGHHVRHPHDHWVTPYIRRRPYYVQPIEVKDVEVAVRIVGQRATTKLTMRLYNPHGAQQEGTMLIPVPHGAVLKGFKLEGVGGTFEAKLLPRDEARQIYDAIVSKLKDPALLEFAGNGVVKSSVFPVPARGEARVQLVYEQWLPMDAGRIDYVLPRTDSLEYKVPWKLTVDWHSTGGLASVFSPSHAIKVDLTQKDRAKVEVTGVMQSGAFRLSAMPRQQSDAVASLFAYPDVAGKGGHFLMLLAPPEPKNKQEIKREVTIVIDKSGSMAGEKMDQVRAAALQVLEGMEDGEAFNVIVYNEAVESFASQPVVKNRDMMLKARSYLNSIRVSGGTNIHGALMKAVNQPARQGFLPLVLFLTDGVPTIGETGEKKIREAIAASNTHKRRIFGFGVGVDVNTPLISRLADDSRAVASYVLPKENVELKVAQVFRRLSGPVIAEPVLESVDAAGNLQPGLITDVVPQRLPDFFARDQVVVLGRYTDQKALHFRLKGMGVKEAREFKFSFTMDKASAEHAFVARLWATRKIALLVEGLRDMGAGGSPFRPQPLDRNDPKVRELIDEIVRLSTRYGVLTEYTAFLAREGAPIQPQAFRQAWEHTADNIGRKALAKRSGVASFNQDMNLKKGKEALYLDRGNSFYNDKLEKVEIATVQQVGSKTFYRRGKEWLDVQHEAPKDETVVEPGTEAFKQLVDDLVAANQQGCLALSGDIRVNLNGKNYRIKNSN